MIRQLSMNENSSGRTRDQQHTGVMYGRECIVTGEHTGRPSSLVWAHTQPNPHYWVSLQCGHRRAHHHPGPPQLLACVEQTLLSVCQSLGYTSVSTSSQSFQLRTCMDLQCSTKPQESTMIPRSITDGREPIVDPVPYDCVCHQTGHCSSLCVYHKLWILPQSGPYLQLLKVLFRHQQPLQELWFPWQCLPKSTPSLMLWPTVCPYTAKPRVLAQSNVLASTSESLPLLKLIHTIQKR